MIILSQVEPILEPLFESEFWYLPTRVSSSSRAASLVPLLESRPQRQDNGYIPPFEYGDRYLQFFGLPQFQAKNIEIKLDKSNRQMIISGKHERNSELLSETCEFMKRILIPENVIIDQIRCFIADNGLMHIEAPITHPTQPQATQHLQKEIPIQILEHGNIEPFYLSTNNKELESKPIETNLKKEANILSGPILVGKEIFDLKQQAHQQQALMTPPPNLVPIREMPIRMLQRPIDQGILCPCCNGRGSKLFGQTNHHHHHDDNYDSGPNDYHHNQIHVQSNPPVLATVETTKTASIEHGKDAGNQKKDYQPKNAPDSGGSRKHRNKKY